MVNGRYLTVMLLLAAAAACMPSQEDWLNDLSLMPPVSVTMQPMKWDVVVVVGVDELGLAHPAASRATAPALRRPEKLSSPVTSSNGAPVTASS